MKSAGARPASHETPLQRWLWWHNKVAVGVLVAAVVLALVVVDRAVLAERYGPYLGRVYGGAIGLVGVEALLWHFLYRRGGNEARWAAGLMGAWFAILILIQLAQASIDVSPNPWSTVLASYMLIAHGTYAMLGSRARH